MEPGQAIRTGIARTGIAASVIAHLSVLLFLLLFGEVHLFGSETSDSVPVNIVTPEELAEKKPELLPAPEAAPSDNAASAAKPDAPNLPASASVPPEPVARPQKQAPPSSSPAEKVPAPPPPSTTPAPAYKPPEPDLTVKYQVMLGLPQNLAPNPPPPAGSGDKPADAAVDPTSGPADIASSLVAEFRRHLRTCSKLPSSIASSDRLKIKLRVFMSPEGRLAAEPALIEASASAKGPALMQGAIGALQACQPYAMLPADRYGEWKVLDLFFTPQDFSG